MRNLWRRRARAARIERTTSPVGGGLRASRWAGVLATCACLGSAPAAAQSSAGSESRAGIDAGEGADATGPRTVIDLRGVSESTTSLAEQVDAAPSTNVRRSGALGAPAFVSIRGADPWQVRVVLDGVPLNGGHNTAFDLSTLPVDLIGRMVVHRSNVPVQLGAPLPGGVLELQTRFDTSGTRVALAGGSFGTRRVSAAHQTSGDAGDLLVSGVYAGANNRFRFFDDGETPFNTADDGTALRRNAHVDTGGVLVRHRARVEGWRITSLGLGTHDAQGVPGFGSDQALQTHLERTRLFGAVRAENGRLGESETGLALVLGTSIELQRYQDPADELGLGAQDDHERAWMVLTGVRPTFHLHETVVLNAVLDWTGEGYRPDTGARPVLQGLVRRDTLAAGLQATWRPWDGRVEVGGSARSDISATRSDVPGLETATSDVSWSPHAGLAVVPWLEQPWSVRGFANVGLADRVPGFFELYGDRGATVGNPDLRPERRFGYDVGVQLSGRTESERLQLGGVDGAITWTFFDRRIEDLIHFVQTGQGVAVAQNIAEAAIRGHELSFAGGWSERLRFGATWSLIDAIDQSGGPENGFQLPSRPVHTFGASSEARWRWLGVEYRVDGNGGFSLDRQERRPMPARVEHDLAVVVRPGWAWRPVLRLEMRNVADARTEQVQLPDGGDTVEVDRAIADFVGQPLPGRAFYVNLTLRPGARSER